MSSKNTTRIRILEATWKLMVDQQGKGVRMSDIARTAGISRQAVYLHFSSRTELMIATAQYVDDIKGLEERLQTFLNAEDGLELIDIAIDVWLGYIPEIFGLAKALMLNRDTDEDAAAAWADRMKVMEGVCQMIIARLASEGILASGWSQRQATEMLLTMLSFANWEHLTHECSWSADQLGRGMKMLVKRTFVSEKSR